MSCFSCAESQADSIQMSFCYVLCSEYIQLISELICVKLCVKNIFKMVDK